MSADQLPIPSLPWSAPPARQISRDEMNLAEFPLTVLSTRASSPDKAGAVKTLEFSDQVRGKNGDVITRHWIITAADKFGLPTSSDDEVLLGLLKLTVDSGFNERKIFFSRYELLKILRWTTEGRSYQRLQRALDRLSGVRIKATNAFYDNETKAHSTRNFGLVDAYEINDGRGVGSKPSFFVWSDALFRSFKAGFIKKFDLDFYLGMRSAVSRRLYRYLDKHFWYRSRVQINLFTLAHEKIGISRNYQYASSLRQQLDPALAELVEAGFLSKSEYLGKGKDTEVVIFAANKTGRVNLQGAGARSSPDSQVDVESGTDEGSSQRGGEIRQRVSALLVARGLKDSQVVRLLAGKTEEAIARIREIVEYFDKLCASNSRLVSRSPVGFLYRAVEHSEQFVLPGDDSRRPAQTSLQLGPAKKPVEVSASATANDSLESEYLVSRRVEIKRMRETLEPETLQRIQKEVETALIKLRGVLSDARLKEVVQHGVDEKVAKLFAIPEFEEWIRTRKKAGKAAA